MPDIEKTQKENWRYIHLFAAFIIGVMLQAILLPCCGGGARVILTYADIFDILVLLRVFAAWGLGEKGKGWIFYAGLLYSSPFWIVWLFDFLNSPLFFPWLA
jgi:hypothetical protein